MQDLFTWLFAAFPMALVLDPKDIHALSKNRKQRSDLKENIMKYFHGTLKNPQKLKQQNTDVVFKSITAQSTRTCSTMLVILLSAKLV